MGVESLENLCLRRMRRDIFRHVQKWKAEEHEKSSLYKIFRKIYGNEVVSILGRITADFQGNSQEFTPYMSRSFRTVLPITKYADVVNFILNPHLTDVCLRMAMNEIITNSIANNCKNLKKLTIVNDSSAALNTDFLKSLGNLVSLNLERCLFPVEQTMKVIADHLVHLRVLHLFFSSINNDGLFILCGHEHPSTDSVSSCAFTKNCSVNTKVKLRCLSVDKSGNISREAFACVLTHIPTLERLEIVSRVRVPAENQRLVLSEVIVDVNESRKAANLPLLQFQMDKLDFIKDSRVLTACLQACPRIKTLSLDFVEESIPGRILAESELCCLEVLRIRCFSINQISGEEFDRFWTKKGLQIKELAVCSSSQSVRLDLDVYAIRKILASCRGVTSLELVNLEVPSLPTKYIWEEYPALGDMTDLHFEAHGEMRSVAMFLYQLIRSLRNESQKLFLSVDNLPEVVKTKQDILGILKEYISNREFAKAGQKGLFRLHFEN